MPSIMGVSLSFLPVIGPIISSVVVEEITEAMNGNSPYNLAHETCRYYAAGGMVGSLLTIAMAVTLLFFGLIPASLSCGFSLVGGMSFAVNILNFSDHLMRDHFA